MNPWWKKVEILSCPFFPILFGMPFLQSPGADQHLRHRGVWVGPHRRFGVLLAGALWADFWWMVRNPAPKGWLKHVETPLEMMGCKKHLSNGDSDFATTVSQHLGTINDCGKQSWNCDCDLIVIINGADFGLLVQSTLRWRSSKRSRKWQRSNNGVPGGQVWVAQWCVCVCAVAAMLTVSWFGDVRRVVNRMVYIDQTDVYDITNASRFFTRSGNEMKRVSFVSLSWSLAGRILRTWSSRCGVGQWEVVYSSSDRLNRRQDTPRQTETPKSWSKILRVFFQTSDWYWLLLLHNYHLRRFYAGWTYRWVLCFQPAIDESVHNTSLRKHFVRQMRCKNRQFTSPELTGQRPVKTFFVSYLLHLDLWRIDKAWMHGFQLLFDTALHQHCRGKKAQTGIFATSVLQPCLPTNQWFTISKDSTGHDSRRWFSGGLHWCPDAWCDLQRNGPKAFESSTFAKSKPEKIISRILKHISTEAPVVFPCTSWFKRLILGVARWGAVYLSSEVSLETAGLPPRSGTLLCVPLNATMDTARPDPNHPLSLDSRSKMIQAFCNLMAWFLTSSFFITFH